MKLLKPRTLLRATAEHPWSSLRDGVLLSAAMTFAVLVALHYDLFAFLSSLADPERAISPAEGVLLAVLFVLCVYVFIAHRYDEERCDESRRAELEREMHALRELAMQDPLTKLPNRRALLTALEESMAVTRSEPLKTVFFMLDLNGFKSVNDEYGHGEGDEVLRLVVQRWCGMMRPGDLLARLGGDEFGVMACGVDVEGAAAVGARLVGALESVIHTRGHLHQIGVAIGAAVIPDDGRTVTAILHKADLAMYRAKAERTSAVVFYDPLLDASSMPHRAAV